MALPELSWRLITHYTAVTGTGDAITYPKCPLNMCWFGKISRYAGNRQLWLQRKTICRGRCQYDLGRITHPLALRPTKFWRRPHPARCISPVQCCSLCQLCQSQLPSNSHLAHGQRKLLPAEWAPHLSLGTGKSHDTSSTFPQPCSNTYPGPAASSLARWWVPEPGVWQRREPSGAARSRWRSRSWGWGPCLERKQHCYNCSLCSTHTGKNPAALPALGILGESHIFMP